MVGFVVGETGGDGDGGDDGVDEDEKGGGSKPSGYGSPHAGKAVAATTALESWRWSWERIGEPLKICSMENKLGRLDLMDINK